MEKNINRFTKEDRDLLDMVTKRIINKLLHQPMSVLKEGTEKGNGEADNLKRIQAVRELFGIEKPVRRADDSE